MIIRKIFNKLTGTKKNERESISGEENFESKCLNEFNQIIEKLEEMYLYVREPNWKKIAATEAIDRLLSGHKRNFVERYVKTLIKTLIDNDFGIQARRNAVRGLGIIFNLLQKNEKEILHDRVINSLLTVLNEESDDLVADSAWALGETGDRQAIEPLIKVIGKGDQKFWQDNRFPQHSSDNFIGDNEYKKTHQYAAWALSKIDENRGMFYDLLYYTYFVAVSEKPQDSFKFKYQLRIHQAASMVNSLELALEALNHRSVVLRESAVNVLGELNDKSSVHAIIAALNDDCVRVQKAAIKVAAKMKIKKAIKPLFALIKDKLTTDSSKVEIFNALDEIDSYDPNEIGDRIIEMLADNNLYLVKQATILVGKLKFGKATDPIIDILRGKIFEQKLNSSNYHKPTLKRTISKIRSRAAFALGEIGNEKARVALEEYLDDDEHWVGKDVEKALNKIKLKNPN